MALQTVDEIKTWFSRAETELEPLHTRMRDDLSLWRMENVYPADSPQPKDKHRTMARNDLRALAEKVIGTLLSAEPDIVLPLIYGQEDKTEAFSQIERMVHIGLDSVNEKLRRRLQGTITSIGANDFSLRGWGCGIWLTLDLPDGIDFDFKRWEPIETYFSVGTEGIYRAAHRRWEPEGQLALEYPGLKLDKTKDTQLEVIDFWEVEKVKNKQTLWNAIIVGTEFAKAPTKQKFTNMPVHIIPVSGPVPATDQSGERLNVEDWGESIFGANRLIAKLVNELDTEMLDHVLSEIHKGLLLSGPGAREIAESIEQYGEDDIPHSTPDDLKAQPVPPRQTPIEAQMLRQSFMLQLERGGLSNISWGQVQGPLSGLAISNLAAQEESFVIPRAQAMAAMIQFGIEAWIHQLSAINKPFEGLFKQGKTLMPVKVQRMEKVPRIVVSIEPKLPGRDLQSMAAAQQMRMVGPGGKPLLSDLTILEQYLKVEDPVEEERRKDVQEAESMPFVRLQKMADSARRKNLTDLADILEKMADRELEKAMGDLGGRQPGLPTPGMPQGPGERPPLPPSEAMSPGAMPPEPGENMPGPNGNNQSPEDAIRQLLMAR